MELEVLYLRRGIVIGLGMLVGLIGLSALLSVNLFPTVSNDGVVYLEYSRDLRSGGVVVEGFRQVGYPIALAAVRATSSLFGAEPLLAMATLQRLLLVLGSVIVFMLWRWWSLPLLAFLASATTIIYPNFLLTEGLGLPLALLLALAAIGYLKLVQSDEPMEKRHILVTLGLIATGISFYLFTVRFTFGVFGAVPLVMMWASLTTPFRRFAISLFAAFIAAAGLFTFLLALDNQAEFGVAAPVAGGEPTRYYYAWMQVFELHPENAREAALAEYYDNGVVHDFSRQVSASGLSYEEQGAVYDDEIHSMIEAAGFSMFRSRLQSMAWSLAGGRLHDVEKETVKMLDARRTDVEDAIYLNQYAATNGIEAFADEYNDSRVAEAVITDPIGVRVPIPHGQTMVRYLLPVAIVIMLLGLHSREVRPTSLAGLLIVVGTAVGLGWVMADNYRFLITSSAAGLAFATDVLVRSKITSSIKAA